MPTENVSLDEYEFPGGAVPVASPDYIESDIPWVEPGEYLNRSRTIAVRPLDDAELTANAAAREAGLPELIKLVVDYGENGLVPAQGDPVRFAPRHYFDSTLRDVTYGGVGQVSGIGRYLAAFPSVVNPEEVASLDGDALKASLKATLSLPVIVVTELEDDYRDRPKDTKPLRTKAFRQPDGSYAKAITIKGVDGAPDRKALARPRIARYKAVE